MSRENTETALTVQLKKLNELIQSMQLPNDPLQNKSIYYREKLTKLKGFTQAQLTLLQIELDLDELVLLDKKAGKDVTDLARITELKKKYYQKSEYQKSEYQKSELEKKLSHRITKLEGFLGKKGISKNKKELWTQKKNLLESAQQFSSDGITREEFYTVLNDNLRWNEGIKNHETERLVMKVIHEVDLKEKAKPLAKSTSSTSIEDLSTSSTELDTKKQNLINKLDKRIAVLEQRQQKTHTFKKYILWEDKINALKETKKRLQAKPPSVEEKISAKFTNTKWDAGFFPSTTKSLVEEADRILNKPKL